MSEIAIIGAGLAGLSGAAALQKLGFRPRLYEQAQALGEVGAGITISPNAAKALIWLGLGPELEETADEPPHNDVRDAMTDALLVRIDRLETRERYGAPYWMMHRADLHQMLVEQVRSRDPDAIVLNAKLASASLNQGKAQLVFASGETLSPSLTIAADGLHSTLRPLVCGEETPTFTGHVAWRCLVPAEQVEPELSSPGSITFVAPERSATLYPVRKGALVNCVGLSRGSFAQAEGWSHDASFADFAQIFADFPAHVLAAFKAGAAHSFRNWGLYARSEVSALAEGNLALIGDAAHPMLPFMGQGAAMAIEDGIVLARSLAAYNTLDQGITAYQAARLDRVRFVQHESNQGGERVQAKDTSALKNKPLRDENSLDIFSYDPTSTEV
jgi:salicylate hydroxylase